MQALRDLWVLGVLGSAASWIDIRLGGEARVVARDAFR
jgi:hypothetical protein